MSKPEEEEVLFAYIAVALHAVSLVLIRVDDGVLIRRFVIYPWKNHLGSSACYMEAYTVVVLIQLPLQPLL